MLNEIHIKNFATIEELTLQLDQGCTMITGETGAGKSIFIQAIELALGARGSLHTIRAGKERAEISLCFDVKHFPAVCEWLSLHELQQENATCIIRRVIKQDGRSSIYINGSPTTLPLVRELGELVFHLHGQSEQQVLLKADNQREILDRYIGHLPLVKQLKSLAGEIKKLTGEIKARTENQNKSNERRDFLRFQLDELSSLNIAAHEWQTLEQDHQKLSHAETLLHHIERSLLLLSHDEERNTISLLREARKLTDAVACFDPKILAFGSALESALIQLNDLSAEMQHYLDTANLDPARLQKIEERLSQLFDLARKHKVKPEDLIARQAELQNEFNHLDSNNDMIQALQAQQKKLIHQYQLLAQQISEQRQGAALSFAKEITETIRHLSLPYGEFTVALEVQENTYSGYGLEKINFLIKTNPDQTAQPLAKVISGGELSRLSLAIHLALTNETTPTLIFDEVDTGIGGATAEKVGKLLRKLGEAYQVFCVTHQPQVAVCGHHHLLVEKRVTAQTTHTQLRILNFAEKTDEIARMLAGEKVTQTTVEHAKEMLLA